MSICSTHSSGVAPEATVCGERVEVDDHQVERLDAELVELLRVRVEPAVGEDPGVHLRVQGLDPAVEALGEAGELLDLGDRHAEALDQRRRAAGGDERDAGVVQAPDQLLEPGLVVDRDERPPDRGLVSCSRHPIRTFLSVDGEALARHPSDGVDEHRPLGDLDPLVQRLRRRRRRAPATATWATIGPVSTPSSTTNSVHPVTLTPYARASAGPCMPGKLGSSAGWVLTNRPSKRGQEVGPTSFMNPAEIDQVGLVLGDRRREGAVPRAAVGVVLHPVHERRDPGPLGAGEPLDAVAVRADRDHLRRRTTGRRRRRAGPGGWCRNRRRGRRGAQARGGV